MDDTSIDKLMDTIMTRIIEMVDVNKIVGDPVETKNGTVIIPVSRVSFGFAAGGDDGKIMDKEKKGSFLGGSGAGVLLHPMAFLVVSDNQVKLLPLNDNAVWERIINAAPELIQELQQLMKNR